MRGDRPIHSQDLFSHFKFTPHARGSTFPTIRTTLGHGVYPACAGIDRVCSSIQRGFSCLPRMRGDRPTCKVMRRSSGRFTPHARGSTPAKNIRGKEVIVYPACAGIDLFSKLFP